jgi:hypothetical protein
MTRNPASRSELTEPATVTAVERRLCALRRGRDRRESCSSKTLLGSRLPALLACQDTDFEGAAPVRLRHSKDDMIRNSTDISFLAPIYAFIENVVSVGILFAVKTAAVAVGSLRGVAKTGSLTLI